MNESARIPPPPPIAAEAPADGADEASAAWIRKVEAAVDGMAATVGAAIADHEAGRIDLAQLRRRCLDAGAVRVDDTLLLWDWVAGRVFAYDGFRVVEVTEPEA
jgi:hypothetical protein